MASPASGDVSADATAANELANQTTDLATLLDKILPVWLQHVGSVKSQTEEAINQLATSFSSINEQFEKAAFKGASGGTHAVENSCSLTTLCERELQPVVASMTAILASKDALVASVYDLAMATVELPSRNSAMVSLMPLP